MQTPALHAPRNPNERGRVPPSRMMSEPYPVECPYCGEAVDVDVDRSGGARQHYVQDCPVCCQPWEVDVVLDRDGDWLVSLRTGDD